MIYIQILTDMRMLQKGVSVGCTQSVYSMVCFFTLLYNSLVEDGPIRILTQCWFMACLQCFDAVGWAAGRASGL